MLQPNPLGQGHNFGPGGRGQKVEAEASGYEVETKAEAILA